VSDQSTDRAEGEEDTQVSRHGGEEATAAKQADGTPPAPPPEVPPPPPPPAPAGAPPPPSAGPGPHDTWPQPAVPAPGPGVGPHPPTPFGYPPGPPGPPPAPAVPDPHGIGQAVGWLGSGSKRAGKPAFPVLAAILAPGDVVELLVQGAVFGQPGVMALVGDRVVLVNAREWKPDVVTLAITPSLLVQGLSHRNMASLHLVDGGIHHVVDQIRDQQLAVAMADQVRARAAAIGGPPPPPAPSPPAPVPPPTDS
jgi:hypothetical protein